MHFTVEKGAMERALKNVAVSTQHKAIIPALSCAKMVVQSGKVTITTTNLDMETCDVIDCQTTADGVMVVPVQTALGIVSNMPVGSRIDFKSKGDSEDVMVISCGKRITEIVCMKADEFPDVLGGQYDVEMKMNAKQLSGVIKKISFAMSQAPERHNLNSVFVAAEEDGGKCYLSCVATDGHRLGFARLELAESISLSGKLLPRKAVAEMVKLIDSDAECTLCFSQNKAKIIIGNMYFATKLVDAVFPDYKKVVPQNNSKIMEVKASSLADELRSVGVVAQGKGVKLTIRPSSFSLECVGPDGSKFETELDCTFVGAEEGDFVTTYNPSFLEDVLKVLDKDESGMVRLTFNEPNSPALLQPVVNGNSYYVVMPMKTE